MEMLNVGMVLIVMMIGTIFFALGDFFGCKGFKTEASLCRGAFVCIALIAPALPHVYNL